MSELTPDPDLARARLILNGYDAPDAQQAEVRARILAFIDEHPLDAHLRSCLEGHLTGSAMLLDHNRERILLTLHKKLGRWLQLGGHCDGDANLVHVAWREAQEESGIPEIEIDPAPLDLDIHAIPERKGVPEHLHLDVRFITVAAKGSVEAISDESLDLRWFTFAEIAGLDVDESMTRAIARLK
ncbi:MAG: 8-oxo-dGTP pyrophosphatase MutT (NUDIX family) [Planctomycetota bacterium]|jgi:8-oxo-dGTP pyrophosphatase MutT (NUDIX family)